MNELVTPGLIDKIKEAAAALPMVEIPTKHFLLDGIYVRQTFIPAGTAFVGRKHKKYHIFMVLKGSAQVTMEDKIVLLRAGMTLMCQPGTQRIGVTVEDTVFAGVFRTDKTDLAEIEAELTEFDPTARYGVGNEIIQEPKCEKLNG
jgi:quercetin dioxygenase-like cupin family protein